MDPFESRREELVARVEAATEKDRKRYVGLAVGALDRLGTSLLSDIHPG